MPPFSMMETGTTNSKIGKRVARVVNMAETTAPSVKEVRSKLWVPFGTHNLFPEFCRALADNSAPLNSCVERMAIFLAGEGMEWKTPDGKPHQRATDYWHNVLLADTTEEDFLYSTALDVALMNARTWEVIYNAKGVPVRLAHMDATRVRMARKNVEGIVDAFYFSSNWELYAGGGKAYEPKAIPAFGSIDRSGSQLMYRKGYKQTRDYYGEPWWLPAIADAEVFARIPIFNRTQLDNGFRPAFHLHVFDNADEVNIDKIDADVEAVFTGANGKTYIVTYGTVAEGAPVLNKLERGDHAGELDAMGEAAERKIIKAFGIPPILMGVPVPTGLQGTGLAIEQELTQFRRTRAEPLQRRFIAADVTKLMVAAGITDAVGTVLPLNPFEFKSDPVLQRQVYVCSTTVNAALIENGKEPLPSMDPRGEMLLVEVMKGGAGMASDINMNVNG